MDFLSYKFKANPFKSTMALLLPVVFLVLPVTLPQNETRLGDTPPEIILSSAQTTQGSVTAIEVSLPAGIKPVDASFAERRIAFFKGLVPENNASEDDGIYQGLIGVDLTARPGLQLLELTLEEDGARQRSYYYSVSIEGGDFTVDRLTLPSHMVSPGKKALRRIIRERKKVVKARKNSAEERLWVTPFIIPVKGKVTSSFGRRRILNGKRKSPHSGVDIRTPRGKRIHASNRARVAFVGHLYYTGKTVILDHGQGLFTSYCHLSKIKVSKGDIVEQGRVVGLAGSTGRSTGPHLHWGAKLHGARVNPLDLVRVTKTMAEFLPTRIGRAETRLGRQDAKLDSSSARL